MKKTLLTGGLLLGFFTLLPAAHADSLEEDFVNQLSRCDRSLFEFIRKNREALQDYAPVENRGRVARFRLTDEEEGRQIVNFKKPMVVNGIRYTGCFQSYLELPLSDAPSGTLKPYYWGLAADSNINAATIAASLPQQNFKRAGEGFMANPQLISDVRRSLKWQHNSMASDGTAPAENTVERVLYITPRKSKKTHELNCTIQGYIPAALAKTILPAW